MFKKEKGSLLKVSNTILLIGIIIMAIDLFYQLLYGLLPEGGDYSNFNIYRLLYNIIPVALNIIIYLIFLYLINNKVNLFDKKYIVDKKALNFILSIVFTISLTNITYWFFSLILNQYYDGLNIYNCISSTTVSFIGLFIINRNDLFAKKNNNGLNSVNAVIFICFLISITAMLSTVFSLFSCNNNIVDVTRNTLFKLVPIIIFAVLLYLVNANKEKLFSKPVFEPKMNFDPETGKPLVDEPIVYNAEGEIINEKKKKN